jgi:hypothetical protein
LLRRRRRQMWIQRARHWFCVAAIPLVLSAGVAVADATIGIDFVGGSNLYPPYTNGGPVGTMQSTEIAGVVPQACWNAAGIGGQNNTTVNRSGNLAAGTVYDSTGAVVPGLSIAWNGWETFSTDIPETPGNNRMMKGYLDAGPASLTATVTVSGLPASYAVAGYDVLVYFDGEQTIGSQDRVGRWRVYDGTNTAAPLLGEAFGRDPAGVDFSGTFVQATGTSAAGATVGNYVRFVGLHAPTLTLEAFGAAGDVPRAPVNGIQIVPAPVPEPSTFVLLGMGAIGLLGFAWRRRKRTT